jgi:mono/diheme cytochrome c family protein
MNPKSKRQALTGVGLLLLAPVVVGLASIRPPQKRKSLARPRSVQPVADLFRNNCARCHGADGRGDTPLGNTYKAPDFTDTGWWQKQYKITSSASLVSIVSHGKGGMPAFGKKLSRTEISRLVAYVRKFKIQKPTD